MNDNKLRFGLILISMLVSVWMLGCDDSSEKDSEENNQCVPAIPVGEGVVGSTCMELEDCVTGYCSVSSHTPSSPDGVCAEAPPLGDVHMLANVRDFMTDELIPNAQIKIGGALDINQNPTGYPVTETFFSDANAAVDRILTGESVSLALGIMAVVETDGYYPTVTGLVKPEAGCGVYPAGIRNPDLKVVKQSDVTLLSDLLLAHDPGLAAKLPLGDNGGVAGLIRDVVTGDMVPGIELRSTRESSTAQIYYLNETKDGFVDTLSTGSGVFVILSAGLAEEFDAYLNNVRVSRKTATVGETVGILLTTTVQIEM